MTTVFNILPIHVNESLACYLLRVATSESVPGVRGLVGHMGMGTSNASLNRNIEKLATFTRQPAAALNAAQVCLHPMQRVLREKFARMSAQAFCPHCVKENGYFRSAWRHGLVTACTHHRCQLVDTCPACNQTVELSRANAFFCGCGQELASIEAPKAESYALWVAAGIGDTSHRESGWPDFGNTADAHWRTFDELIFLFGSYNQRSADETTQPRRSGKFHTVADADAFLKTACTGFESFPASFEQEVMRRLECGDKSKAGLVNRLGHWFRAFRGLTEGSYPELRAAFARSVAENFDGHDSKNPWIYELAPARHLSITEAASRLGVKASRLGAMLRNMPGVGQLKDNTFNTVTQEQCDALRQHLDSALNLSEVLNGTGLTESVLKQLIRVGLLPKRERPHWDLNVYKPFDVVDVHAMQCALFEFVEPAERNDLQTVRINDVNKRIATNKAVVDELFEKIAQGALKAVNVAIPARVGDLLFSREQVAHIIGNAHDVAMMTAEQLARMTGWKSESIRHWIECGLLGGEEGQWGGRLAYWVSMRAVHEFMKHYKVVSELAGQLGTSPKALSDKLRKLGVPIIGTLQVTPGVSRGGVIALRDILVSGLHQPQAQLFGQSTDEAADELMHV